MSGEERQRSEVDCFHDEDSEIPHELSWMADLPECDRRLFAEEMSQLLAEAAENDDLAPVQQALREWRATAEVHADPELSQRLSGPIVANGPRVAKPAVTACLDDDSRNDTPTTTTLDLDSTPRPEPQEQLSPARPEPAPTTALDTERPSDHGDGPASGYGASLDQCPQDKRDASINADTSEMLTDCVNEMNTIDDQLQDDETEYGAEFDDINRIGAEPTPATDAFPA